MLFRSLRLAYEALAHGGAWPAVLNAANEEAVAAFLEGRIRFVDIPDVIARALDVADRHVSAPHSLADVRAADTWAHAHARETIGTLPSS